MIDWSKFGGDSDNILFLSNVHLYDVEDVSVILRKNPDIDLVLCITNGDQSREEDSLREDGWKEIFTGDKNIHPRQRELDSEYIKLWYLDPKNYELVPDEVIQNRLERFKKVKGYEFLNKPTEFFKEIHPFSESGINNAIVSSATHCDGLTSSGMWPFVSSYRHLNKKVSDDIKKIHMDVFGFVLPRIDPFRNKKMEGFAELSTFIERLKEGEHENV